METKTRTEEVTTPNFRQAVQFPSRKKAEAAARLIGWRIVDVTDIEIMGFRLWTICTPHMMYLTQKGYDDLRSGRES